MSRRYKSPTPGLAELVLAAIGLTVLALLCATAAIRAAFADPPPIGWTTPAHFVRVVDGDTLEIEIRRRVTVRLLDCWAPESRTKDDHEKELGLAAKANLEALAAGQALTLHIPADAGSDLSDVFTFGRVVGTVWTTDRPDRSINQRQIDAGVAWPTKAEQKAAVERTRNPSRKPRKAKE